MLAVRDPRSISILLDAGPLSNLNKYFQYENPMTNPFGNG
jgi:hypothetical protein